MRVYYRFSRPRILAIFRSSFEFYSKFAADFGFLYDLRTRVLNNFHFGLRSLIFAFGFWTRISVLMTYAKTIFMITYLVSFETWDISFLFNINRYHTMIRNKCFYYYFFNRDLYRGCFWQIHGGNFVYVKICRCT